ncbi:MAG TPA: hypothetical protein VK152_09685 [Paludibacter sp.]|nr:hypothetical protein [Paludibacter sp.]
MASVLFSKRFAVLVLLFCGVFPVPATQPDSVTTIYKNGEFLSQHQLKTKASDSIISFVTSKLVHDFRSAPSDLFNWALKDLGLQSSDNELIIIFKSSRYDPATGISHGLFDIEIPHIKKFKDVKVDAIVARKVYKNGVTKVSAHIIYSSLLLKSALGTLTVVPLKNNEKLLLTNVHIHFGWFFNIFITQRRYKGIVEWRVRKFTENMREECRFQQKGTMDNNKKLTGNSLNKKTK